MKEKKIKIFVSYHAEAFRVKNEIFEPIQIGQDVFGYSLEGMISENNGDNISNKQPIYSDLVASYWLLKNYIDNCPEDYIGVCHYRRIFSFKRPTKWRNIKEKIKCNAAVYLMPFKNVGASLLDWNAHYTYHESEYTQFIEDFTKDIQSDIQSGKHLIYGYKPIKFSGMKVYVHYERYLTSDGLRLFKELIGELYPEYLESFKEMCEGTVLYYSNCHIMQKDLFREYTSMLFHLTSEHEKRLVEDGYLIDPTNEKLFARGEGYLAEMMLSAFIYHNLRKNKNNVKLLYGVLYNVL